MITNDKWNNVKDVMPLHEEMTTIQVLTFGYDDWYVANYFDREFYSRQDNDENGNSLNISKHITHWQYLPETP